MSRRSRSADAPFETPTVTIQDVARAARVSTATVSRALTKPDVVARSTRDRVAAAARALGYAPHLSAKAWRAKTKLVLALIPQLGSPFFTPFLNAATDFLADSGLCAVVADLQGSPKKEEHYARLLREGHFAGLILFTGQIPGSRGTITPRELIREGVPIVLGCNEIPNTRDLPVFDVANRDAAKRMVSYLISIGHRHIAHIRGPEGNVEAAERLAGYQEALKAAGIRFEEDLVWQGDFYLGSGIAAAGRFLAHTKRPTAVFAANDQMAMGFITELKSQNVSVPGDVSVAGFDDIEYSTIFDPALTTMHQPRIEIGRLAAAELLRWIEGNVEQVPPNRVRLECELIIRGSTQSLRSVNAPRAPRKRTATDRNRRSRTSL